MASQGLTPLQVTGALRIAYRHRSRIGSVLIAQGVITPVALVDALISQSLDRRLAGLPPRYLGEHLLACGEITPDQLAAALYSQLLRGQGRSPAPIGQLLVGQGVLDPGALAVALTGKAATPPPPLSPGKARALAGATAIVLEDEPNLGGLLSALITQATGLAARHLTTVGEATAAVRAAAPRLVVTDRRLPDGDGLMLASHIRAQCPETAIVLMSADTSPALRGLAAAATIGHFVPKPFDLSMMVESVRAALRDTAGAWR